MTVHISDSKADQRPIPLLTVSEGKCVRFHDDVWVLFVNIYRQLDSLQITTAKSIEDSGFLGR